MVSRDSIIDRQVVSLGHEILTNGATLDDRNARLEICKHIIM